MNAPVTAPPPLPASPAATGLQNPRTIRIQGWMLAVIGPCLALGMASIAWSLFVTIAHPDGPSRWHGDAAFTRYTFLALGEVFFFGLIATAAGIYQALKSRRSSVFFGLMLLTVGDIVYAGWHIISAH